MGVFDAVPVIGDVVDVAQKGFNFFKDIFNTDSSRAVQNNQFLMRQQHIFNREMQDQQQKYNVENMNLSNSFNRANMERAFEQNKALMSNQAIFNAMLSNRARDIFNARAAGLNPAEMTGSYVGSVSGQSASAPASAPAPVSAPSVGSPTASPSKYAAGSGTSYADYLEKTAIAKERDSATGANQSTENLNNSKAELNKIDAVTRNTKNINDILEQFARIDKLRADKVVSDAQANRLRKLLEHEIRNLDSSSENLEAQSQAVLENVQTRKNELEETKRHNAVEEALQHYQNVTNRMQVNINEQTAQAVIEREYALADKFTAEALKTNEEKKHVAELMLSEIKLNEAQKDLAVAKRHGQTTENYYMALKLKAQILNSILDSYLKFETARSEGIKQIKEGIGIVLDVATGGAGKAAKAVKAAKGAKGSSYNEDAWRGFFDN